MEWTIILALAVMVPVILFPVAFVWFLNIAGLVALLRKKRAEKRLTKEVCVGG